MSIDDVLELAERMRADADAPRPLIIREEDVARLTLEDQRQFWALARKARLRSLDA